MDVRKAIIDRLTEADRPITAAALAVAVGCSVRTVKNQVSILNRQLGNPIVASRRGYALNRDRIADLSEAASRSAEQGPDNRASRLILETLRRDAGTPPLSIYDLAEEMSVSESTIRRSLAKAKVLCEEYGLTLHTSGDRISVEGGEPGKRRLIAYLYSSELEVGSASRASLQNIFGATDLDFIRNCIDSECTSFHYYVNGYTMDSLVLDTAILLDRARRNHTETGPHAGGGDGATERETLLAKALAARFETRFSVRLDDHAIESLALLLMASLLRIDYRGIGMDQLRRVVGGQTLELVDQICGYVRDNYLLEFSSMELYARFALHVRNLVLRASFNQVNRCLVTDVIKRSCPLLYDCAASIASIIQEATACRIVEDEVSFIALHLGSLLEYEERTGDKIRAILIAPRYYDLDTRLERDVLRAFAADVEVVDVATSDGDLASRPDADLIISTMPIRPPSSSDFVVVTAIGLEEDRRRIREAIERIRSRLRRADFLGRLTEISDPLMFHRNLDADRDGIISVLASQMVDLGYANEGFADEVLQRERELSTGYDGVAVPHAIALTGRRTGMNICLFDRPVRWGAKNVQVVLMFTVSRDHIGLFRAVFDRLVVLLSEPAILPQVAATRSHAAFIQAILDASECIDGSPTRAQRT